MNVKNYHKIIEKKDTLNMFLKNIDNKNYDPLTTEDEKKLLNIYYNDNTDDNVKIKIKQDLANHNLRYIYSIARCYGKNDIDKIMELVSVGTIGFYKTFDNYNLDCNTKFNTLSQFYIRREINYYINNDNLMIRTTNNNILLPKIKKIQDDYNNNFGKLPTVHELKDILQKKYNIEVNDVNYLNTISFTSLSDIINVNDNSNLEQSQYNYKFNDYTATDNDYQSTIDNEFNANTVKLLINKLSDKEKQIIQMAYGINELQTPYSIETIGEILNINPQSVRKTKYKAEQKLKQLASNLNYNF